MLQTPSSCQAASCPRPSRIALFAGFLAAQARLMLRATAGGYRRLQTNVRLRATHRQLSQLPDHTLMDIGLTRAELRDAVWKQDAERERARRRSTAPSVGFD